MRALSVILGKNVNYPLESMDGSLVDAGKRHRSAD